MFNNPEIFEALDSFYAYECGATDSGIKDDYLKNKLLDYLNLTPQRGEIINFCVECYSDLEGYTKEDRADFRKWIDGELSLRPSCYPFVIGG